MQSLDASLALVDLDAVSRTISSRLQLKLRRHNLIQTDCSYPFKVQLELVDTNGNTHISCTVASYVALSAPRIPQNIPEAPLKLPLTRCYLLLIVLRYDIFACVGMNQHTLCVGEPAHEPPVE
jgi:hypothetical protein